MSSKTSKSATHKPQRSASPSPQEGDGPQLVQYGRGLAVFNAHKDLNPVFKALDGRANGSLTHPDTGERTFGWVIRSQHRELLEEFLEHQNVEKFFQDHKEIIPYVYKPREKVARDDVSSAKSGGINLNTAVRLFSKDKIFPGPVVVYLLQKLSTGTKSSRELVTKTITLPAEKVVYTIYEGPEESVAEQVDAAEYVASKKGKTVKVIKVFPTLVAVRSKIPEVQAVDETEEMAVEEEVKKVKKSRRKDEEVVEESAEEAE